MRHFVLIVLVLGTPAHAKSRLSSRGRAMVREIHRSTGYVLHDSGPRANPRDRTGWSDRGVRRMKQVLTALPPQLKHLKRLDDRKPDSITRQRWHGYFITRDAMSQQEQEALLAAEARLKQKLARGEGGLGARAQLALVRGIRALKMGTVFGNAYRDRPEIRLYNELFRGSSLPGLRRMLAFTTVHEIGHQQLFKDGELRRAWREHYFTRGGQQEYAGWCGYAAGSHDEGYGVGIGTFAVAPKLLQKKAPNTYAFFVERFGEDAFKQLRGGPTERWAIQATYGLGDWLAGLGR